MSIRYKNNNKSIFKNEYVSLLTFLHKLALYIIKYVYRLFYLIRALVHFSLANFKRTSILQDM